MKKREDLAPERLREVLTYDPETGVFRWRISRTRCRPGAEAGCVSDSGYRRICVDGVLYRAHRLAWLYMRGKWPRYTIDHINGDRADNRWANLRDVSIRLNCQNYHARKPAKSGVIGIEVRERKSGTRYRVRIGHFGRSMALGTYATLEEAVAARTEARLTMHRGFLPEESQKDAA